MNNKVIIYKLAEPNIDSELAVIHPIEECGLSIEEIALKDVPPNTPYKIIDKDELPNNRDNRNEWKWENFE